MPTTHQRSLTLPTSLISNGESSTEGGFQPIDGIWNLNLGPKTDQLGGEELLIGSNSNEGTYVSSIYFVSLISLEENR